MKSLQEYIKEGVIKAGDFSKFSLNELIQYGVLKGVDSNFSRNELVKLGTAFYDKYPANHNDNGIVQDIDVKCDVMNTTLFFTFFWGNCDIKTRISVVDEVLNLIVDIIGGNKGNENNIKRLITRL